MWRDLDPISRGPEAPISNADTRRTQIDGKAAPSPKIGGSTYQVDVVHQEIGIVDETHREDIAAAKVEYGVCAID